ncbi:MAG: LysR family transcriptional regulator, partial [Chloroflexi bacterium]|nr:LysR family transcriptional regulator [Chloroflexota bacterium]
MNLQQLRYAAQVLRDGLNVSEAAATLHTSQPGVSKQLRLLEQELGAEIFVREGRRLTAVTPAGQEILAGIERILAEIANLRVVGEEHADPGRGRLVLAVTHTQARYSLPKVVTAFKRRYPEVHLKILQGNPAQLARM